MVQAEGWAGSDGVNGQLWEGCLEEGALEELVSQSGTKRKVGSRNHRKPLPSHQVLI